MSTIEDFENAPVGAIATSPNGNTAFKTGRRTLEWFIFSSRGRLYDTLCSDEMVGYTLNPAAPTTAREALTLAWELAYPVKEGQKGESGTELIARFEDRDFRIYRALEPFDGDSVQRCAEVRALDPLPETEPDWLDAPAVFARCGYCSQEDYGLQITLHGPVSNGQNWECTECQTATGWSALRDVTPLYPKEDA